MRWIHAVAAAVAATGMVSSVAKATLTVSVVPLPITAAAKAADSPNLDNARSYDLRVTQTAERWNVTTMQLNLPATDSSGHPFTGSFYQSPGATISHGGHIQQTTFNSNTPQYYDTAVNVTMNDSNRTDVLGDSDYPAAGSGTTAVQNSTHLSIAWGDHNGDTNTTATTGGSFSIGHITVTGNVGAYFQGYVAGNVNLNQKQSFTAYLPMLGDANTDGSIDINDLAAVRNNFGSPGGPGDANADGSIDINDLAAVRNNFGNALTNPGAPPPGQALGSLVPEPSMVGLMLGIAGIFSRRRRA